MLSDELWGLAKIHNIQVKLIFISHVRFYILQIFVQGHKNLNRAVHDDVVAIEMLPEEEWTCPSSLVLEETEEKSDTVDIDAEVGRSIVVEICLTVFHKIVTLYDFENKAF